MFRSRQVKKWSAVELWYLIQNYDVLSIENLCKDLLKHEYQVREQIEKLSLGKDSHGLYRPRGIFNCALPECRQAFVASGTERKKGNARFCSSECLSDSQRIRRPSKETIKTDYSSGLSTNDLAKKYGVSKGTVYNWIKYYGIDTRSLSDSLKEFFQNEKGFSAVKKRLETLEQRYGTRVPPPKKNKKYKGGRRNDLGLSVRSGWEANVLRYFKYQGVEFEYEPKLFIFHGIKKGNLSYLPDVYLPKEDLWIEIKGQLLPGDKVKIKRFKKYYPKEFSKLRVIVRSENVKAAQFYKGLGIPVYAYYRDLNSKYKNTIPNWE